MPAGRPAAAQRLGSLVLPAAAASLLGRRAIFGLVLAVLVFAAATIPAFRTAENLANVATQAAALGLVALGQTFVIVGGWIDLSVGQLLGLIVVLMCAWMDGDSARTVPAVLLAAGLGSAVGASQGALLRLLRLHPLILTFGTLSILQGVIFATTDRSIGAASAEIAWLANGRIGGVPVALLVLVVAGVGSHALLTRTRFGQHLRAAGGHAENARRASVSLTRVAVAAFALSGLGAGLGAVLVAGRIGSGYPNAGAGFELDAIVAVALGGTSLAGGRGTVAGTLAAVFLLALASNVLNLLEVSSFVQIFAKGLIVVVAVLVGQRAPKERG
jgi:ribose/xylose/arabinose/galactoside ABC-type transport system permease subunit